MMREKVKTNRERETSIDYFRMSHDANVKTLNSRLEVVSILSRLRQHVTMHHRASGEKWVAMGED